MRSWYRSMQETWKRRKAALIDRIASATASSLIALLDLFEPHRGLLRLHEGTPHKTGTLRVSKTVIGYHDSPERGRLKFVIALDRNGYSRKWKVLKAIKKHF